MRISIVTNAFNQGQFLAEAMKSVLTQSWPDVEYIVIDPGSTDETPEIIKKFMARFPGRIRHIQEADSGPADGLNKGFALATGELFGYLNADDVYLPGCLEEAARAAQKHPRAAAVFADGFKAGADDRIVKRVMSLRFSPRMFVFGGALVLQQSTFYRAEAFRRVGGFNVANRTSWDAEILLEMALRKMPLVHVPGYWSVFRVHPASITGSQKLKEQNRQNDARYFRRVMGRERGPLDRILAKIVFAYSCVTQPRASAVRIMDRLAPMNRKNITIANVAARRA